MKGKPEMTLTYSELLRRSSAVATALRTTWKLKPGDKALLLYPMGLEFVIAFWGCLQAGVVAVPQYPPAPGSLARDVERLLVTTADCTPSVVLTESSYRRSITVRPYPNLSPTLTLALPTLILALPPPHAPNGLEWVSVAGVERGGGGQGRDSAMAGGAVAKHESAEAQHHRQQRQHRPSQRA